MLNIPKFCFFLTLLWMSMCFHAPQMQLRLCLKHPHQSSSSWLIKRRIIWKDTCSCQIHRKMSFMWETCGMLTFLIHSRPFLILVSATSWKKLVIDRTLTLSLLRTKESLLLNDHSAFSSRKVMWKTKSSNKGVANGEVVRVVVKQILPTNTRINV